MSNDRYQEIRDALAMGPTPGPWAVNPGMAQVDAMPSTLPVCKLLWPTTKRTEAETWANGQLIATCDPDTIRELLAERDQLAAALEAAREDAERYRWLRKGESDDIAVVRGLGAMDYGMSAVAYTYSEEIDGDDLDAAIDQARGKGGQPGETM